MRARIMLAVTIGIATSIAVAARSTTGAARTSTGAPWRASTVDGSGDTERVTQGASAIRQRFVVGTHRRQSMRATYELAFVSGGAFAGELALRVDGQWSTTVVAVDASRALVRGEVHASVTGAERMDELLRALRTPHYISYGTDGHVEHVYVPRDFDPIASGLIRSLAASTQVVDGNGAWEATERDTTGEYVASYRRQGNVIEKTKLRYVPSDRYEVSDLAARSTIHVDAARWPTQVEEAHAMRVTLRKTLDVVSKSRLQMQLVDVNTIAVGSVELADYVALALDATPTADRAREDRALVAGASLDDILAELDRGDADPQRVFARLGAIMRLDPSTTDDVLARIDAGAKHTDVLIDALGDTGTPEAADALVTVLDSDDLDADARARAAVAMATVANPTVDMTNALARALDSNEPDVRMASSLALAWRHPTSVHRAVEPSVDELGAARSSSEMRPGERSFAPVTRGVTGVRRRSWRDARLATGAAVADVGAVQRRTDVEEPACEVADPVARARGVRHGGYGRATRSRR